MNFEDANSLVDEIHCLSFQLICAVEVSQDENFCGVLHGEVTAEGILTHDLQTLQGILENTGTTSAQAWLWAERYRGCFLQLHLV